MGRTIMNFRALISVLLLAFFAGVSSADADTWVFFGCVGDAPGIYRSTLDSTTGELSKPTRLVEGPGMSFFALSPDNTKLYVVQRGNGGFVSSFDVDAKTGDLKKLNQTEIGSAGACHVAVTPDGKTVSTADYGDGAVASFAVETNGALKPRDANKGLFKHEGSSTNAKRQTKPHAHCTIPSPDGKFIYAADLGVDAIFIYGVKGPGQLELMKTTKVKNLGGGPRHFAFHPSGDFAFANLELTSQVTGFSVNKTTGELTELKTVSTLPSPHEGNSTSELLCHPSGKFFFCANRGHNSIAAFEYEDGGLLKPIGHESCGGEIPRNFGISPNGDWLITANQSSNNAGVLKVDSKTGSLSLLKDGGVKLPRPMCVRFLPIAE